jgi:hypothetical protein
VTLLKTSTRHTPYALKKAQSGRALTLLQSLGQRLLFTIKAISLRAWSVLSLTKYYLANGPARQLITGFLPACLLVTLKEINNDKSIQQLRLQELIFLHSKMIAEALMSSVTVGMYVVAFIGASLGIVAIIKERGDNPKQTDMFWGGTVACGLMFFTLFFINYLLTFSL